MTKLVSSSYERAKQLLIDHMDLLNKIASELLEKEVLNTAELDAIVGVSSEDMDKVQQVSEVGEAASPKHGS